VYSELADLELQLRLPRYFSFTMGHYLGPLELIEEGFAEVFDQEYCKGPGMTELQHPVWSFCDGSTPASEYVSSRSENFDGDPVALVQLVLDAG
jgi:hypothetical protein